MHTNQSHSVIIQSHGFSNALDFVESGPATDLSIKISFYNSFGLERCINHCTQVSNWVAMDNQKVSTKSAGRKKKWRGNFDKNVFPKVILVLRHSFMIFSSKTLLMAKCWVSIESLLVLFYELI